MNSKNIAILAYLTPFGWLLALILNGSCKDEFSSFHIRQMLGLIVAAFVLGWIPIVQYLAFIILFIFWIIGLMAAIKKEEKTIPLIGEYFQQWFKAI